MSIYDTEAGRKAMEKVEYQFADAYPADAMRAMIEWLEDHYPGAFFEKFPEGNHTVSVLRPASPDCPDLVREFLSDAPTLDEALVAAVLASKEKT